MTNKHNILYDREDILPYVQDVQDFADTEKKALGFLAGDAYEKAAENEKIIVAIDEETNEYMGHVFFGGVYPNGRIFQTLVKDECRKTGLGKTLVTALVKLLEKRGYTSITARVATDLKSANVFYEQMGFKTARTIDSGKKSGRRLNLRLRILGNPTLFTLQPEPLPANNFYLPKNTSASAPIYLIDLNVIFDAVRKRVRTEQANALFKAGIQNLIRVAVSEELIVELERNTGQGKSDPLLEMSKNFTSLANPSTAIINKTIKDLAPIIFPDRHRINQLSVQDKSDLTHIATAIKHNVSGFVTSERKILNAANHLREHYGLDIISLYEINELIKDDPEITAPSIQTDDMSTLVVSNLEATEVKNAIQSLSIPKGDLPRRDNCKDQGIHHLVISSRGGKYIAYAWWSRIKGPLPNNHAYIHVEPTNGQASTLITFIADKIMRDCSRNTMSFINLKGNTENDDVFQAFHQNGFRTTSSEAQKDAVFTKVCLGSVIHPDNWQKFRLDIQKITDGIKFPETMAPIKLGTDYITITTQDNVKVEIELNELEQLFYPALYTDKSNEGVIMPIKRSYSEELFNTHEQLSLLNSKEAILCQERVYFCDQKVANTLEVGQLIFFYESGSERGGRQEIIAVARVSQSNVLLVDNLKSDLTNRGVIDVTTLKNISLSGHMTVVEFRNILHFKKPISYKRLCEIGCNDGANFVTAKKISAKLALQIISEGFLDE